MGRLNDPWFLGLVVLCADETIIILMILWMRITGRLVVKTRKE